MGTKWNVDENGILTKPLIVGDGAGQYVKVPVLTTAQRNALTATSGMIIYNSTNVQFECYNGGAWNPLPVSNLQTEIRDSLPFPEARTGGNGTRIAQTQYEGASYRIVRPVNFNRICMRVTGGSFPTTLAVLIYQGNNGGQDNNSIIPRKVAALASPVAGTGNLDINLAAPVTLLPGWFFLLFGRDGANTATIRTYIVSANDYVTSNIENYMHPCVFTTTINAGLSPATLNTLPVAGGGDLTPSVSDLAPIIRLETQP